jgi:hypothetical protein
MTENKGKGGYPLRSGMAPFLVENRGTGSHNLQRFQNR